MNFDSIGFAALCVAAVVLLNIVTNYRVRLVAIVVLNFFFISTFFSAPLAIVPLIFFILFGYVAIQAAFRASVSGLAILIAAIVLLFIWLKQYSVIEFLPIFEFPYLVVGLSYFLFRIVHLVVNVYQRALHPPSLFEYLAYLSFFLTFVSGPIQRYGDFEKQTRKPAILRSSKELHSVLKRIIFGLFLVGVVTHVTSYVFVKLESPFYDVLDANALSVRGILLYCAATTAFTVHLYVGFVGYMHMVIGIGALCGFRLPENFNRPYACKNFLDFWSRWHITLSEWFKCYVFNPMLKNLSERWGTPATSAYWGIAAFFVTFILIGIWHGTTRAYIVYGLFLGFGVAVNKLYQVWFTVYFGRNSYKVLVSRTWYICLSRAAALSYFGVALTCMWISPLHVGLFASGSSLVLAGIVLVVLIVFVFAISLVVRHTTNILQHSIVFRKAQPTTASLSPWLAPAWTAFRIFIVISLVNIAGGPAPEFVYKAF